MLKQRVKVSLQTRNILPPIISSGSNSFAFQQDEKNDNLTKDDTLSSNITSDDYTYSPIEEDTKNLIEESLNDETSRDKSSKESKNILPKEETTNIVKDESLLKIAYDFAVSIRTYEKKVPKKNKRIDYKSRHSILLLGDELLSNSSDSEGKTKEKILDLENEPSNDVKYDVLYDLSDSPTSKKIIGRPKTSTPLMSTKRYCCSNCEFKATTLCSLLRHTNSVHSTSREITLEECSHATSSSLYGQLKEVHITERFCCEYCSYQNSRKDKLHLHRKAVHGKTIDESVIPRKKVGRPNVCTLLMNTKRYCCSNCEYKTKTFCSLLRHTNSVHSTIRELTCKECSYATSRSSNLYRHQKEVHKTARFCCEYCSYQCARKDNLHLHRKSVHDKTIDDLFACSVCDSKYYYRQALTRHIKDQHSLA